MRSKHARGDKKFYNKKERGRQKAQHAYKLKSRIRETKTAVLGQHSHHFVFFSFTLILHKIREIK